MQQPDIDLDVIFGVTLSEKYWLFKFKRFDVV